MSTESAIKADLNALVKELALEHVRDGKYPSSLVLSGQNGNKFNSDKIEVAYSPLGDNEYCVQAKKRSSSVYIFHATQNGKVALGGCPSTSESCFAFSSNTITGYYTHESNNSSNPACPRAVIIPSSIGGSEVTSIAASSLASKGLTSVFIPESVTSIGIGAFQGNSITSANLPGNLTTVETALFFGNSLKEITIPDSVTSIGVASFNGNSLVSVVFGKSLQTIGSGAFQNNNIYTIELPPSVTTISSSAFTDNQCCTRKLSQDDCVEWSFEQRCRITHYWKFTHNYWVCWACQ